MSWFYNLHTIYFLMGFEIECDRKGNSMTWKTVTTTVLVYFFWMTSSLSSYIDRYNITHRNKWQSQLFCLAGFSLDWIWSLKLTESEVEETEVFSWRSTISFIIWAAFRAPTFLALSTFPSGVNPRLNISQSQATTASDFFFACFLFGFEAHPDIWKSAEYMSF